MPLNCLGKDELGIKPIKEENEFIDGLEKIGIKDCDMTEVVEE